MLTPRVRSPRKRVGPPRSVEAVESHHSHQHNPGQTDARIPADPCVARGGKTTAGVTVHNVAMQILQNQKTPYSQPPADARCLNICPISD